MAKAKRKSPKAPAKKAAAKKSPAKKVTRKKVAKRSKRDMKAATDKLQRDLAEMQTKLREMMKEDGINPDEFAVQSAKDFAEQMQEISRGFREALKKAAMADGKLVPGQVLTVRGRRVFLKPRAGCPEGSMDPEHYDLVYEMIH